MARTSLMRQESPVSMQQSVSPAPFAAESSPSMTERSTRVASTVWLWAFMSRRSSIQSSSVWLPAPMPSSFVTMERSFLSGRSGSVSTLCWNWLPPSTSATRLAGRALAEKNSFSAAVSAASLVMMPLMRQPSGSSA